MALKTPYRIGSSLLTFLLSSIQLGSGGARLKNNGGKIEARTADDSTFTTMAVADPSGDDDVANKRFVMTYAAGDDVVRDFEVDATGGATATATNTIPANAKLGLVLIEVTEAYDGTAPTIKIGTTADAEAFVASGTIDPTVLGIYPLYSLASVGGSAVTPKVTIGGTGNTTGACKVRFYYTKTPKT